MLTDIGTEELAHMEMVSAIVHQLTKDLTPQEIMEGNFERYYVDHTLALWPQSAGGIPFNACFFQSKGDPITDMVENMAAEQKQEPPMIIFYVLSMIMMYVILLNS